MILTFMMERQVDLPNVSIIGKDVSQMNFHDIPRQIGDDDHLGRNPGASIFCDFFSSTV